MASNDVHKALPRRLAVMLPLAIFAPGCGTVFFPSSVPSSPATIEDGNTDAGGLRTIGTERGEPNGDFSLAIPALFDAFDRASLRGSVQFVGDLDVFDLGALAAGDRIRVAVDASEGALDAALALFDAEQRLFIENDDRGGDDRPLDSLVDEIVRHDSGPYYLVIGAAAFAGSGAERLGRYRIDISLERGGEVPAPVRQTMLLDFDGGRVDAPSIPVSFVEPFDADQILLRCGAGHRCEIITEVEAFDAAKIAPEFTGQTQALMDVIVQTVRSNFVRFGVDIVTSDEPLPEEGTYATVFLGGSNPIAFGIAQSIDHFNADPSDVVVVFTGSFQPDVFTFSPGLDALGAAIGNVASHEAGHILGLNHVDDARDLMDAVSPPDTLLLDQEFRTAPLSEQIVPLGVQDGPLLLDEIVGPR